MKPIIRTAPARLIVLTVSLLVLLVLLQTGVRVLAHAVQGATRTALAVVLELIVCAVMILAYRAEVRWLERRPADELGAAGSGPLMLSGLLLGAALFAGVYAVLFGLLHLMNPGATLLSALAIALEAGVLLAVAYALTRRLWFSIGIHFGWNFTEGGIFGAAVSGGPHSDGLVNFTVSGPTLLTGGKFGPEASIVAVVVCLAAAVALGFLTVKRGRWRPRPALWG